MQYFSGKFSVKCIQQFRMSDEAQSLKLITIILQN